LSNIIQEKDLLLVVDKHPTQSREVTVKPREHMSGRRWVRDQNFEHDFKHGGVETMHTTMYTKTLGLVHEDNLAIDGI
jgi:hypothetical protein